MATPQAVRESLHIVARNRALFGHRRSRGWGVSMAEDDIVRVIRMFEQNGAAWALVGAHAVGLLTEPRATADFDFVIEERKLEPVLRALADHTRGDRSRSQGAVPAGGQIDRAVEPARRSRVANCACRRVDWC